MFDVDSRNILMEVETDVYVLGVILDALPAMAGCIWRDKTLRQLHGKMKARVGEMRVEYESKHDIEKMLVFGFSQVI